MSDRKWFKKKRFGWGWSPATWEGWLVVLLYTLAVTLVSILLPAQRGFLVMLLTALLIFICWLKGEKLF